jgi:hypothetical protein
MFIETDKLPAWTVIQVTTHTLTLKETFDTPARLQAWHFEK